MRAKEVKNTFIKLNKVLEFITEEDKKGNHYDAIEMRKDMGKVGKVLKELEDMKKIEFRSDLKWYPKGDL